MRRFERPRGRQRIATAAVLGCAWLVAAACGSTGDSAPSITGSSNAPDARSSPEGQAGTYEGGDSDASEPSEGALRDAIGSNEADGGPEGSPAALGPATDGPDIFDTPNTPSTSGALDAADAAHAREVLDAGPALDAPDALDAADGHSPDSSEALDAAKGDSPACGVCDAAGDGSDVSEQSDAVGALSATEAMLLNTRDMECLACAQRNQCVGGAANCETLGNATATSGPEAGTQREQLCLSTLACVLQSRCYNKGAGISVCICGLEFPSTCAASGPASGLDSQCVAPEQAGLETTSAAAELGAQSSPSLGGGVANAILLCISNANCSSCL